MHVYCIYLELPNQTYALARAAKTTICTNLRFELLPPTYMISTQLRRIKSARQNATKHCDARADPTISMTHDQRTSTQVKIPTHQAQKTQLLSDKCRVFQAKIPIAGSTVAYSYGSQQSAGSSLSPAVTLLLANSEWQQKNDNNRLRRGFPSSHQVAMMH